MYTYWRKEALRAIQWTDITAEQYASCTCASYIGGSTWYLSPDLGVLIAHAMAPRQVREHFETRSALRMESYQR